jgi:hypothetical protein
VPRKPPMASGAHGGLVHVDTSQKKIRLIFFAVFRSLKLF